MCTKRKKWSKSREERNAPPSTDDEASSPEKSARCSHRHNLVYEDESKKRKHNKKNVCWEYIAKIDFKLDDLRESKSAALCARVWKKGKKCSLQIVQMFLLHLFHNMLRLWRCCQVFKCCCWGYFFSSKLLYIYNMQKINEWVEKLLTLRAGKDRRILFGFIVSVVVYIYLCIFKETVRRSVNFNSFRSNNSNSLAEDHLKL